MNQPNAGFETDLRISTRPVNLGLLLVGMIIFILSFYRSEFTRAIAESSFGMAIICGALIAWSNSAGADYLCSGTTNDRARRNSGCDQRITTPVNPCSY